MVPGEGGVEPEGEGPEHRIRQDERQDLYGAKEKHGSVTPRSTRLESSQHPHSQNNS